MGSEKALGMSDFTLQPAGCVLLRTGWVGTGLDPSFGRRSVSSVLIGCPKWLCLSASCTIPPCPHAPPPLLWHYNGRPNYREQLLKSSKWKQVVRSETVWKLLTEWHCLLAHFRFKCVSVWLWTQLGTVIAIQKNNSLKALMTMRQKLI